MHTNVSAEVTASLNKRDIITLLEEGEIETDGLSIQVVDANASELLSAIESNTEVEQ